MHDLHRVVLEGAGGVAAMLDTDGVHYSGLGKETLGKAVATVLRQAALSATTPGINLTKDSIDLGIIVEDAARALGFYMDTLGLRYDAIGAATLPDGSVMHRLLCGTSLIKVRELPKAPAAKSAPGGITTSTGLRCASITLLSNCPNPSLCSR